MAIRSDFFKSTASDRKYGADRFANRFRQFMTDGVFVDDSTALTTELEVTADDATLVVSVDLGAGNVQGYNVEVYTAAYDITLSAGDATHPRIDRIVLHLDTAEASRSITIIALEGTPGAVPVAPTLTQSGTVYEISLAQILVPQSAALILDSNVTDERDMVEIKVKPVGLIEGDAILAAQVFS